MASVRHSFTSGDGKERVTITEGNIKSGLTFAMSPVRVQLVAVGTDAPVGPERVVTPEGTLVTLARVQTLIEILAPPVSPRGVAGAALALKSSPEVGAGSVTAEVESLTLVLVLALPTCGVQPVAGGTLAPERAVRVDAVSALTEVLHHLTLIEVPGVAPQAAPAPTLRTELGELLAGVGRTGLAGAARTPGLAQGTAAGLTGHVGGVGSQAVARPVLGVTRSLSPVLAVLAVPGQFPAGLALALEAALGVPTEAGTAETEVHQALVDVLTPSARAGELVAPGTGTEVGAQHVLTVSRRLTEARVRTLVSVAAVPTVLSQFVAGGTVTGDATHRVATPPVTTELEHGGSGPALVNILAVSLGPHREAGVTPAHVASQGVETGPIATDTRAPGTLVNVDTLILVGGETEAGQAAALEAAGDVVAVSVAADLELPALVDVPAVPASDVQTVAGRTLTEETAGRVDTLGQAGARVEAGQGALVGVDTLKYRRDVSQEQLNIDLHSVPGESPRHECSRAHSRTCSSPGCSYRSRAGRYPDTETSQC